MSTEEPEFIEELSPFEEAEDLLVWESSADPPPQDILSEPCVQHYIKTFAFSIIPLLITDSRLQIIYGNNSFESGIVKNKGFLKESLLNIADPFPNRTDIMQLLQSIKSESSGFSWNGRFYFSHVDFLNIQANVLIVPIFPAQERHERLPLGYLCLFDDVTEENRNILHSTFLGLLEASKLKDNDTGYHIKRVGEYSRALSKHLFKKHLFPEIDTQFIENITFLAPMHDVGKIGTPDEILHKSGPLTKTEWSLMKEHTINGGFIMGGYPGEMARQIPLFHHERWDGTGYPYQFSENMIPLAARIVSIADVYDALRMRRTYKDYYSHEKACEIIAGDAGTHFDPVLIDNFFEIENRFKDIFNLLHDQ